MYMTDADKKAVPIFFSMLIKNMTITQLREFENHVKNGFVLEYTKRECKRKKELNQ